MDEDTTARAVIGTMAPFFIVADVTRSLAFYCDGLGFEIVHRNDERAPFFAVLRRDGAMLFLKSETGVAPMPNRGRHPHLAWDAYSFTPDPDGLAAEFAARAVGFTQPLGDRSDGLRGFELTDPDGYVLFYGRPIGD